MATARQAKKVETIAIKAANFQVLEFVVTGTAPLMQNRFTEKVKGSIAETQKAGTTAKSKRNRAPRDFDSDFNNAMHVSKDGWIGIPAAAFRNACIDVCRMVNFKMVHAKMSIFIEADGSDRVDGQPIVRLIAGKPERSEMAGRLPNGAPNICVRPMWREWSIKLRVRYDADQFTANDVANLLERAGMQIGIGEGRPFSKNSNGMGYGTFTIKSKKEAA